MDLCVLILIAVVGSKHILKHRLKSKDLSSSFMAEETLNALKTKQAEGEQTEAEEEHEVVYLCSSDGCGKVFSDSSSLRKHAHVHGEKQYICHYEGCGKVCGLGVCQ